MSSEFLRIRGAGEHNLKNIDIDLPREKLIVFTGVSGSGKSSLAFDTIYAEGQRRYVESLSTYARQFLEQLHKPAIESIEGLTPSIAIEQRGASHNPRSTVATVTEIYDYLRLLYARTGTPYSPTTGKPIERQSAEQMVDRILALKAGTRFMVLASLIRGRKGTHADVIKMANREGFVRLRVDGELVDVRSVPALDKRKRHDIELVVDRLVMKGSSLRGRLTDSVETALRFGEGLMFCTTEQADGSWRDAAYSEQFACPVSGFSIPELAPRLFSFNSPYGACPACDGLGTHMKLDPELVMPDKSRSLDDGAIEAWRRGGHRMNIFYNRALRRLASDFKIDLTKPWSQLTDRQQRLILHGSDSLRGAKGKSTGKSWEGVIPNLERRFAKTDSEFVKHRIHQYMSAHDCPACDGARLRPEALCVRVGKLNIQQLTRLTTTEALEFVSGVKLRREKAIIGQPILKELRERLGFLADVGLEYLTLDRTSSTLSGGEAQRIRLASQLGSHLVGVTYVLDEPTIGLHQRDNDRLINTLMKLRDLGNTIVVVEHDEQVIRRADHIVDLGPGAGESGGRLVAQGTADEIAAVDDSVTGWYLSGRERIEVPAERRRIHPGRWITVRGAAANNLKSIDVKFPIGVFTCVTGVSGSGKSTLVNDILHRAVSRILHHARGKPGRHKTVLGVGHLDKIIVIDQSPIGRTPRSNPATYTGVFDEIRALFTKSPEARIRGYPPGRFSFNVKGGRCEVCQGQGTMLIEMHFLPDVYVRCETCKGRRYNLETLEVRYKGLNIADVLALSITEALRMFKNIPRLLAGLQTLVDVGLGYMKLGQSSTTLSGGEAQRVKLATELSRRSTGKTLYILDEPTTGLHFHDISKLMAVLSRLTDLGNTVIVIEHNLDVIKTADWIIDLGPEGGDAGGEIVAEGTPEDVARQADSYTGQYLKRVLKRRQKPAVKRA